MKWRPKTIAGTVYNLSHLDPFVIACPRGHGAPYKVRVVFGSRVFTEKAEAHHSPDLIIMDGNTPRAFCLKRYAHSLHIKAAVNRSIGGLVYNNSGRTVISARLPGLTGPYLIAFTIRPVINPHYDAVMTVVSAHHRPNLDETLPYANFKAVVGATMAKAKIGWKKK